MKQFKVKIVKPFLITQIKISDVWILAAPRTMFLACEEDREENFGKGMKGSHAHQRQCTL